MERARFDRQTGPFVRLHSQIAIDAFPVDHDFGIEFGIERLVAFDAKHFHTHIDNLHISFISRSMIHDKRAIVNTGAGAGT